MQKKGSALSVIESEGLAYLSENSVHFCLWYAMIFQIDETDSGEGIVDLLSNRVLILSRAAQERCE